MCYREICVFQTRNPYSFPYSSLEKPVTHRLQPKIGQYNWNCTSKSHLWTHRGKLQIVICIFGWWSSRLLCVKPTLSYLFKIFLQHLIMRLLERIQNNLLPLFTLQSFTWEIWMLRSSVVLLVQLLRIVHTRGHGYDHSFDTLERLCTFTTSILSLTLI